MVGPYTQSFSISHLKSSLTQALDEISQELAQEGSGEEY
jgi:hypothetical protein